MLGKYYIKIWSSHNSCLCNIYLVMVTFGSCHWQHHSDQSRRERCTDSCCSCWRGSGCCGYWRGSCSRGYWRGSNCYYWKDSCSYFLPHQGRILSLCSELTVSFSFHKGWSWRLHWSDLSQSPRPRHPDQSPGPRCPEPGCLWTAWCWCSEARGHPAHVIQPPGEMWAVSSSWLPTWRRLRELNKEWGKFNLERSGHHPQLWSHVCWLTRRETKMFVRKKSTRIIVQIHQIYCSVTINIIQTKKKCLKSYRFNIFSSPHVPCLYIFYLGNPDELSLVSPRIWWSSWVIPNPPSRYCCNQDLGGHSHL